VSYSVSRHLRWYRYGYRWPGYRQFVLAQPQFPFFSGEFQRTRPEGCSAFKKLYEGLYLSPKNSPWIAQGLGWWMWLYRKRPHLRCIAMSLTPKYSRIMPVRSCPVAKINNTGVLNYASCTRAYQPFSVLTSSTTERTAFVKEGRKEGRKEGGLFGVLRQRAPATAAKFPRC
jgi:hypothetical protein